MWSFFYQGLKRTFGGLLLASLAIAAASQAADDTLYWNVTLPRATDQSVNIVLAPVNSVPGEARYPTLGDAIDSVDSDTQIESLVLGWALSQDYLGIQADIRAFFETNYPDEYAELLASDDVPVAWSYPVPLGEKLREAIAASRLIAEIKPVLVERCLVIEAIGFDSPRVQVEDSPVFRAFVGVNLKSCS